MAIPERVPPRECVATTAFAFRSILWMFPQAPQPFAANAVFPPRYSSHSALLLFHFFGRVGNTPDQVTGPDVFACAYGRGLSGDEPSAVTIGARIACLSSIYRFLIRMGAVASKPCDALERPKPTPAPPQGLAGDDIRRLLTMIPDTRVGLRDRAIVLTLTLTGRRRSEVINLRAGDLSSEGSPVVYAYHGRGGKQGRRAPPPGVGFQGRLRLRLRTMTAG